MSLLRALRAYVGLGPEEDYDDHYPGSPARSRAETATSGPRSSRRTRVPNVYLDDYGVGSRSVFDDERDHEVVDIRNPKVDTQLAGRQVSTGRRPNQSRSRIGERDSRRERSLSENGELVDQISISSRSSNGDDAGGDDSRATRGALSSRSVPDSSERTSTDRKSSEREKGESEDVVDNGDEVPQGAIVRSIDSARSRPRTLNPESFSDAKHVADEFKRGTPVVINLQGLDRDLVRRLVDFASGICYALDGSMEKLAPQVFLLTPDGLNVSEADRRRIEERGYAR